MEKAGFVIKKPDKNDARIIHLYPTQKAMAVPDNIRKKMDRLEAVITKGMEGDTALQFAKYLQNAIDNLLENCGECHKENEGDENEC